MLITFFFPFNMYSKEIPKTPPITNADVKLIEMSFFCNLVSSKEGSAICISDLKSATLEVKKSCFSYCIGCSRGGTIFFVSKSLGINDTSFDVCYTYQSDDGSYGNAIFAEVEEAEIQRSGFFYCGPPKMFTSDSTQYLKISSSAVINYLNNTDCTNGYGATGPCFNGISTKRCIICYVNVIRGEGYHILAHYGKFPIDFYYFSTINVTTRYKYAIEVSSPMSFFYSYIYISNFAASGELIFKDCYGNLNKEGFIKTSTTVTAEYHAKRGDGCWLERRCSKEDRTSWMKSAISLLHPVSLLF